VYRGDRREATRLVHWSPALLEGGTPSATGDVYGLAATLTTLINGTLHLLGVAEEGLAALIAAALRVRESPALSGDGTVALSRQAGAMPGTYVAAPAPAGQLVCFTVGVLAERTDGTGQHRPVRPVLSHAEWRAAG
jgi:hypothetical protein